jgi:hypothetical protein
MTIPESLLEFKWIESKLDYRMIHFCKLSNSVHLDFEYYIILFKYK